MAPTSILRRRGWPATSQACLVLVAGLSLPSAAEDDANESLEDDHRGCDPDRAILGPGWRPRSRSRRPKRSSASWRGDIADLVRFEPGVSVSGTGSRFGLTGFKIRGIGGNRVLTLIDGVRVPDEFSFGPFLSARRDFVDIDSLKRLEIARGPISSLYGSDALGGVVALATKEPGDQLGEDGHLRRPEGRPFGCGLKLRGHRELGRRGGLRRGLADLHPAHGE